LLSFMRLRCKEVAIRRMIDAATAKPSCCVIYGECVTVRTVAGSSHRDRETLSGSGSLKNKVFQTAYFSDWKVEFTVILATILCLGPTESVA
jgi:hypothetical protein